MNLPSVSDYSLLEKIGSGSYATVYKAFKKVCILMSDGNIYKSYDNSVVTRLTGTIICIYSL